MGAPGGFEPPPRPTGGGVVLLDDFCHRAGLDRVSVEALLRSGKIGGGLWKDDHQGRAFGLFEDDLPTAERLRSLGVSVSIHYDPDDLRAGTDDDGRPGPDELLLPEGRVLVAAVHGEPSPHLEAGPRSSFLCAGSSRDVVVRSADGRCVWSERHVPPGALLPRDWGAEALAMTDVAHLMDWLNGQDVADLTESGAVGTSENYGPFEARTHPEHRFVTSVSVGGDRAWRNVLEMTAYRLVERDDVLLGTGDLDPRHLLERLA